MADTGAPSEGPAIPQTERVQNPWPARRVVMVTLTVLAVILAFGLLLRFYTVLFVLFVGIVISIAIRPATDWLHGRRLPLPLAVISVYVVAAMVTVGFVMLVVPLLAEQVAAIAANIPKYYQTLRDTLIQSNIILIRAFAFQTPLQLNLQPARSEGTGPPALDVPALFDSSARACFVAISVLTLAYYWTMSGERSTRALLLRLPLESRDSVRDLIAQMEGKVGAFLRGQSVLCLAVAAAMLVALIVIQLPYALSLALLAGVFEAVPILGPTLGAIPALLVALAAAPDKVIWIIVAVIIIQQLESNVLIPRIMDRSVGVNPVVSILAIVGFGSLLGLPGALLAIPMAAIIQVVLSTIVFEPHARILRNEGRGKASVLRYEVQQLQEDVRKQLRDKDAAADGETDRVEDLIESIAGDVDSLLANRDHADVVEVES